MPKLMSMYNLRESCLKKHTKMEQRSQNRADLTASMFACVFGVYLKVMKPLMSKLFWITRLLRKQWNNIIAKTMRTVCSSIDIDIISSSLTNWSTQYISRRMVGTTTASISISFIFKQWEQSRPWQLSYDLFKSKYILRKQIPMSTFLPSECRKCLAASAVCYASIEDFNWHRQQYLQQEALPPCLQLHLWDLLERPPDHHHHSVHPRHPSQN